MLTLICFSFIGSTPVCMSQKLKTLLMNSSTRCTFVLYRFPHLLLEKQTHRLSFILIWIHTRRMLAGEKLMFSETIFIERGIEKIWDCCGEKANGSSLLNSESCGLKEKKRQTFYVVMWWNRIIYPARTHQCSKAKKKKKKTFKRTISPVSVCFISGT